MCAGIKIMVGERPADFSAIAPGSFLASRYEIREPLGQGGMGMVYKAYDRVLDEVVAIKTLRSEVAGSPKVARRFRSEIKLARKVRHPNVCAIHEYGDDRGCHYISMEYVEGIDLRRLVRGRGDLPRDEAYRLAIQVADGLQAIHEAGIIHRDLKTANIMRDSHGQVRLMDFGIAKEAIGDGAAEVTLAGEVFGTPEYMSPEQVRGKGVTFRSDVYSLGIVVFEIFTGDVPFRASTALAVMFKQLEDWPPLEEAELPGDLAPLLAAALAKDPEHRHATAGEVAEALRRAAGEAGPRKAEPSTITLDQQQKVSENTLPALIEALTDEDPEIRRATAEMLGGMGPFGDTAVPALRKAEEDPDVSVARAAATAVVSIMGAPGRTTRGFSASHLRGVTFLSEALGDGDPETRAAAARALGELGPEAKDAIPALMNARGDPDLSVGEAARAALKRVSAMPSDADSGLLTPSGPTRVLTELPWSATRSEAADGAAADLLPSLEAPDPAARREAIEALGQLGAEAKDAVPALLRSRKDADATVAGAAMAALGKIAVTPEAVSTLVESLTIVEAAPRERRGLPRPIPEFILALVKALLKTHYYSPDHPSGQQAREGLYELFRRALDRRRELTLLFVGQRARDTTTPSGVLVELFGEEPLPLSRAVPPGAAELYEPKFTEFFTRHDLASVSLREDLSAQEFERFVTLMADFSDTTVEDRSARFGQRLAEEGLQRISVIFRSELLAEQRRIPWRIDVALSRLRKDVRTIPFYRTLSDAEFRQLKFRIIDDCIRPIRHPVFIRDLMANADLIERELFAIKDIEVVDEVLAMLSPEMLDAVVEETVREVIRLTDKDDRPAWQEALLGRLRRLLRKVGARAIHEHGEASARAFQEAFRRGLLEVSDLPPRAREAVRQEALAEVLAERSDAFLSDLHEHKGSSAFATLEPLADIAGERLLERLLGTGSVDEGQRLMALLREAGRRVEPHFSDQILTRLAGVLRSGDAKERESARALFVFAGAKAVPVLIDVLDEACRAEIRGGAPTTHRPEARGSPTPRGSALRKMVPGALVLLAAASSEAHRELRQALSRPGASPLFLQDIIDILASVGGDQHGGIAAFAQHPDGEVRIHALHALQSLIGSQAEAYLLGALEDTVPEVRIQALTSIGRLEPMPHRSQLRLLALVDGRAQPEGLRIAALNALGSLGNARLPNGSRLEDLCLAILQERRGVLSRLIGRLARSSNGKMSLASVEVLGKVGGARSLETLRDLMPGASEELRGAMKKSARRIKARLG